MTEREPMTPTGYEALKDELKRLKTLERPQVSKEIEEARAHGDLSENAEYHAAREKQSFIEGRIQEIESKLALAEVIDPASLSGDRVVFGATVTLLDLDSDEETTYKIVGHDEADVKAKKISVRAPLARACLGKHEGDEITLKRPKSGGDRVYELVKVEFG
jgi:transcription elongation factor GreA